MKVIGPRTIPRESDRQRFRRQAAQKLKSARAPPRRRPRRRARPAGVRPSLGAERQGGRETPFWENGSAIAAAQSCGGDLVGGGEEEISVAQRLSHLLRHGVE